MLTRIRLAVLGVFGDGRGRDYRGVDASRCGHHPSARLDHHRQRHLDHMTEQEKKSMKSTLRTEAGQSLILFMFMIMALVGVAALTVDVGMAYRERANEQQASDAAALAAADVLYAHGSIDQAKTAARSIATANGYTDGVNGVTVTVNIPPTSGDYVGQSKFAEVQIAGQAHAEFANVWGVSIFAVQGRSVATGNIASGAYGIVALNPTVCQAINLNGSIDIVIHAAGIFDNSNCPGDAFHANGNVTVYTQENDIVGGWTEIGSVSITPPPVDANPITDPLAGLSAPTVPTNVQTCPTYQGNPGTSVLQPGRYNCAIDPSGPWNVTFTPGNYYITGGVVADGGGNITFGIGQYTLGGVGLQVTGSGGITDNFAVIYVESGSVNLTGNGVTRITAPSSGVYDGVAIFQSRTDSNQVNLKGTSFTNGGGAVYAPDAKISLVGTATSSNMQFISDTFDMSGAANLDLTNTDFVPITVSQLRLVE